MFLSWFIRISESFRKKDEKLKESKNIVDSIVKCKKLYKELIVKAHPDKHLNDIDYAQDLSQRINSNRYNYNELLKIKIEMKNKSML